MASILELIGKGKVVGIDIDIRAHNRDLIERHAMAKRVVLIEGDSTDSNTLAKVKAEIPAGGSVMVVLDSDHSREHVLAELRSYGPLVTMGCYLVVADTILGHLDASQTPRNRSQLYLKGNEPLSALEMLSQGDESFRDRPGGERQTDPVEFARRLFAVRGRPSLDHRPDCNRTSNKRCPDFRIRSTTRRQ